VRLPVAGALTLVAALLATGTPLPGQEPEEDPAREVYVPLAEFHPYSEQDELAVEGVTLIRVRRPDQSEALVARETTGWEHGSIRRTGSFSPCSRHHTQTPRPVPSSSNLAKTVRIA